MKMDDNLKQISMMLTILVTLGGALGGLYHFAYDAGYRVGSAESKSNSWSQMLKSASDCDKKVQDLRDNLLECKFKRIQ